MKCEKVSAKLSEIVSAEMSVITREILRTIVSANMSAIMRSLVNVKLSAMIANMKSLVK